MLCDQCGAHNPDENNFCGQCGVRLLRHPILTLAEPLKPLRNASEGSALPSLGVDDLKGANDLEKWQPEKAIVVAPDPIRPPTYLEEEIAAAPRPVSEHADPAETSPEPPQEQTTISGPSFLGLTASSADDQTSYLLEDAGSRGSKTWIVLAILLAVLVGIVWWQREAIQRAGFNLPFLHSASQPAPANAPPANNSGSTTGSTPQPDKTSADQADRFTTTDPSSASSAGATAPSNPAVSNSADTAITESSLSRQAQESKQRQSTVQSASDAPVQSSQASPAAQPDPHQNQLLLMGEKYLYGRGVPRSCEQAMVYFRAAADQNNAPAMSHLAALYNSGECVKQDTGQAYGWLMRAHDADPNNAWIEHDLEIMKRQMAAK